MQTVLARNSQFDGLSEDLENDVGIDAGIGKDKSGMVLSFSNMIKVMQDTFASLPDHRQGDNGTYEIKDAAVGAFGVYFTQSPSFLAHQRDMQRQKGRNNASSLFGVERIPSDNQIRSLLDPIEPHHLHAPFWELYEGLQSGGHLDAYQDVAANYLCALDGTYYFSSQRIHCENCTVRSHGDKTYYSHAAITPVLTAPGQRHVIPLEPEFILPQDGETKQDCEQQAAKRWVVRNGARFPPYKVTILADDLHSHQPFCALLLEHNLNFIMTCKPDSHAALYEEVDLLSRVDGIEVLRLRQWNGRFTEVWQCRFTNQVPLRSGVDALKVNWCEVTIYREETGERLYHNAFVTNHLLTEKNVQAVIRAGRTRWKVENENNNVLKNYGYHLEHNYGHGQQYLSAILVMLNLLAFLFHTILDLTDRIYQMVRQELGARKTFFEDIRALTRYLYFNSWDALLTFMFEQLELELEPD